MAAQKRVGVIEELLAGHVGHSAEQRLQRLELVDVVVDPGLQHRAVILAAGIELELRQPLLAQP
jgi:hypothetical protein